MIARRFYLAAVAGVAILAVVAAHAAKPKASRTAPSQVSEEILRKRQDVMKRIEKATKQKPNVPPTDGMLLKILAETSGARRALEIGSSNGYSALWIGQGLERNGGRMSTIEIDASRAKQCRDNLKEAGLDQVVTSIEGDAFDEIPKIKGTFDFVFIHAGEKDYKRFYDLVYPRVVPGGLIIAHDTIRFAGDMKDFLEAVNNNPDLDTVTLSTTREDGLTVSFKKK
ncbi:class I SAM-dependent methyltransferase [Candidatus Sumerlaeota bacterium]|nr:class I SAM-dependent methyltransferase [Candidatus Sumerlaeota bacterium]